MKRMNLKRPNKQLVATTLTIATLGMGVTISPVANYYPIVAHAAKQRSHANAAVSVNSIAAKVTAMSVAASSDFTAFSNAKLTIDADYARAKQDVQSSSDSMAAQKQFAATFEHSQATSSAAITASSANSQFTNLNSLAHQYQTEANSAAAAGKNGIVNTNLKAVKDNFKYAENLLRTLHKLTDQAVNYANQSHGSFNTGSGNIDKDTPELSAAQSKLRKAEKKLKKAKSKQAKKAAQKLVKKAKQAVKTAEEM